jgi:hypothetical protein
MTGSHDVAGAGAAGQPSPSPGSSSAGSGTAGAGAAGAAAASGASGAASGGAGTGSSAGGNGGIAGNPVARAVPTTGCGADPGQAAGTMVPYTIETSGTKSADCADSVCGPWTYTRQYFIALPVGYDKTKAYPLVFETPGCGGTGINGYTLNSLNNGLPANDSVDNTVIRVGLTPPPNSIGVATRPGQGCFDFTDGDNSVEWIFYEKLYDRLSGLLCFDKNRVFTAGSVSGGSSLANELGCKYAGDPKRPIRGAMSSSGGLPQLEAPVLPTCTDKPMAGMWVEQTGDANAPFTNIEYAIARAMKVNGCTPGTGYDDATFEDFPIGGGNYDSTCKRIKGCPELTPLVVCPLLGTGHSTNESVANPGFATFIKLFEKPPLLDH